RPRHVEPVDPKRIPVFIDDDGVGGGVTDQADGYCFVGVSGASVARDPDGYPNRRSELWFAAADRARRRQLDLSRLPRASQDRLRQQLMAPTWKLDSAGRRVVERKEETKEKLGRSPDDADGFNTSFCEHVGGLGIVHAPPPTHGMTDGRGPRPRR
ncbi:MAG TPA: hypothetical protein VKD72_33160, partial [Gemmataceae bacterium]|nr:hypothetical protein [Gemmataceae bacterium]